MIYAQVFSNDPQLHLVNEIPIPPLVATCHQAVQEGLRFFFVLRGPWALDVTKRYKGPRIRKHSFLTAPPIINNNILFQNLVVLTRMADRWPQYGRANVSTIWWSFSVHPSSLGDEKVSVTVTQVEDATRQQIDKNESTKVVLAKTCGTLTGVLSRRIGKKEVEEQGLGLAEMRKILWELQWISQRFEKPRFVPLEVVEERRQPG